MRAFLGLGSNLGDRWAYLRDAIASLPDVVAVSSVYETSPVGGPEGQGPYLNAAAELQTDIAPRDLLRLLLDVEGRLGRVRAEKTVDPSEWFFKAHFFQDPVQPGTLGLDSGEVHWLDAPVRSGRTS